MNSYKPGTTTSAKVIRIEENGFWLQVNGEKLFVSFDDYPGFRRASPEEIYNISAVYPDGVWWFHLDEGIEFEALRYPERYPLRAKKDGR